MNRNGRGSYSSSPRGRGRHAWRTVVADSSPHYNSPVPADGSSNERMTGSLDRKPHSAWQVKGLNSVGVVSRNHENMTPAARQGQQQGSSMYRGESHYHGGRSKQWKAAPKTSNSDPYHAKKIGSMPFEAKVPVDFDRSLMGGVDHLTDVSRLSLESALKYSHSSSGAVVPECVVIGHDLKNNEQSNCSTPAGVFDNLVGAVSQNHERVTPAGHQGQQQGSSTYRGESYCRVDKAKQRKVASKASNNNDSSHAKKIESTPFGAKVPVNLDRSFMGGVNHLTDVSRLLLESAVDNSHSSSGAKVPECTFNEHDLKNNEHSNCSTPVEVFDICPPKSDSVFQLKPSLLAKNREKRNEMKNAIDGRKGNSILRSGMVLLKSYFSSSEQANILKICRNHGLGPAGFYQPHFREGGKLHLRMMCFGEFWDPETTKYGKVRPMDQEKPPPVPKEFLTLVDRAIRDSHSLIAEASKIENVDDVLPPVKPDICLVNYYATTGRLGLHQDKDEGRESLRKGISIVSFSIGDSAEFLYGDECDAEKAKKITLESGDVLIFGGKSRHIFHGVSKIVPDTAPKSLLQETNFRPGRLNLTFRQHF